MLMTRFRTVVAFGFLATILSACAPAARESALTATPSPLPSASAPARFSLTGCYDDNLAEVIPALRRSYTAMRARSPSSLTRAPVKAGRVADWLRICEAQEGASVVGNEGARLFLEQWVVTLPLPDNDVGGTLTGYQRADAVASRRRTKRFQYPIYRMPVAPAARVTRAQAVGDRIQRNPNTAQFLPSTASRQ